MRIAQVAPLHESVPPLLYGGTERVVSYLTEELARQGHEVTLYASGDSKTRAHLRPGCERALRLNAAALRDPLACHFLLCEIAAQEASRYDVLHFHLDYFPFSLIRRSGLPALTTVHSRLDIPDLFPLYREFNDMHLVSISDAQRQPMPWASWLATVHHGLPEELHRPCYCPENYLAFIGRVSPEKRVEWACEIACRAGMRLRVAAKIDAADSEYFRKAGAYLRSPQVEYLGEIGESEKAEFLGRARALLLPLDWPEPFGLVMIEALACGTPVIAFRRGAVEEILEHGVTGFIVDSIEEAVEAVGRLGTLDRRACRRAFEQRFTARRMCEEYVRAYQWVIDRQSRAAGENRDLPLAS
jgi:glycosyltransferase involved in cell wall biosynthesis